MYRCLTLIMSGLICFFISLSSYADLPCYYQELTAREKLDLLWNEITLSHAEDPLPPLAGDSFSEVLEKLKGLFRLNPTFDTASDEMPEGRVKIIHANGSVGKIALVPAPDHPFTGIYQTGAVGLARLSLATPPSDDNYIPGLAIKFLISNHPSLNLQVMNLLEGQKGNWNYFAKDFSNQIPHPTSWTLKAIEKIFEWTRDPANNLPLWHLASWTGEGKFNGIPIFPERIYFRPTSLVKDLIPENAREDFRVSFSGVPMGAIYEVYGEYQGTEYHVGTLMLESPLLASNYGDKKLFFQHQR
ncbi:hypothetical protein OQJ18_14340 [Fluoribacter dumoffii]|uniref:Uncharacterized protein n=1 Tax=Fluoribacter dumoffii TaxID=463 RepID=A0A377GEQ0_9GAMM|nr:hypothetical protein [Fluoribacter dumoffii]KTC91112.1 hypothetical protein Ldum_2180 [Fluoribacter dumoffii NY 23]MCW8387720.1 hypothetical protein [Fluoribacter dumoffii]MCW8416721.1 hypothetical protein [Fluoribacter dumoffii]MCW8455439.1 hypothetical protein [Fluoribacter dumoffii]MCW8460483.1 hypothetical protein [Fluoribacter dumoffii]